MLTEGDMRNILRHRCEAVGGQAEFARQAGVSEGLVSLVMLGKRSVGKKLAEAMGYQKKVVFESLQSKSGKA